MTIDDKNSPEYIKAVAKDLNEKFQTWVKTNEKFDDTARRFGKAAGPLLAQIVRPCGPYLSGSIKVFEGFIEMFGWATERVASAIPAVEAATALLKETHDAAGTPSLEQIEEWLTPGWGGDGKPVGGDDCPVTKAEGAR